MSAESTDVVVIGSGFGGSVVAETLATGGRTVVVLERGALHPPGSFPRDPHGLATNLWSPTAGRFGMFDVWAFRRMWAIVASGVGGGSLIYANVLLRKPAGSFAEPTPDGGVWHWPIDEDELDDHYGVVEGMLGVEVYPYADTPKRIAMQAAADRMPPGVQWRPAPLGVTFSGPGGTAPDLRFSDGSENLHGVPRRTCRLCGECDIGCNEGAKNTVDLTCLSRAARHGAEIRPLTEVRRIEPLGDGRWRVRYVLHDPARRVDSRSKLVEQVLECRQLVLSAGALGTTYLLARSGIGGPLVGSRFCGNGDVLSILRDANRSIAPSVGTVITSTFEVPGPEMAGVGHRRHYVQDGGNPVFLSWLYEMGGMPGAAGRSAGFAVRRAWNHLRGTPRAQVSGDIGRLLDARSDRSMPILAMGQDTPWGRLRLGDDGLELDWKFDWSKGHFDAADRSIRDVARALGAKPSWLSLAVIKRAVTVHPLGGAPMGRDSAEGVTDPEGRVFGNPGLYVADGSVMPGPTGPNPSLTIAALAHRTALAMAADAS